MIASVAHLGNNSRLPNTFADLLGDMHQYQSDELSIRANIIGAFETIRQATAIGA